jgi:hypothetical protein
MSVRKNKKAYKRPTARTASRAAKYEEYLELLKLMKEAAKKNLMAALISFGAAAQMLAITATPRPRDVDPVEWKKNRALAIMNLAIDSAQALTKNYAQEIPAI